ncbi:MAG: glutathione S-transferase N-terminal domain-containing protein, partial [Plesiomonas shigelloides]
MLTVYGDLLSGNCYKIKLILQLLSIPHQWQHVDVLSGETRSAAFLAKNPVGKIPCLQLENGEYLSESN